jgi:hypothetical protein
MEEERQAELEEIRTNYAQKQKELLEMQGILMAAQNGGEEFKKQQMEQVQKLTVVKRQDDERKRELEAQIAHLEGRITLNETTLRERDDEIITFQRQTEELERQN